MDILTPISQTKEKLKEHFNEIKHSLKARTGRFSSHYDDHLTYIRNFLLYVLIYGAMINYALTIILSVPIDYYTFPAWGILFYLIKEEFPEIVKKCKRKR